MILTPMILSPMILSQLDTTIIDLNMQRIARDYPVGDIIQRHGHSNPQLIRALAEVALETGDGPPPSEAAELQIGLQPTDGRR
jgi:hypothetical protein